MIKLNTHLSLMTQEERANAFTHGIGFGAIIVFSPFLLASQPYSPQFIGLCSFVFGMSFMFFCSTVYHMVIDERRKKIWRTIDHISIYILISCSYTPFILIYYNEPAGLQFLSFHWAMACFGIVFKLFFRERHELLSVIFYLILGWMVIFIFKTMTSNMNEQVKFWLFLGGVSYTLGIIFYMWDSLKWNHAIWHIFVNIGCAGHFIALLIS